MYTCGTKQKKQTTMEKKLLEEAVEFTAGEVCSS
jgi:RNA polymerase-interacting CarD/CdnL/TRCF family regulator